MPCRLLRGQLYWPPRPGQLGAHVPALRNLLQIAPRPTLHSSILSFLGPLGPFSRVSEGWILSPSPGRACLSVQGLRVGSCKGSLVLPLSLPLCQPLPTTCSSGSKGGGLDPSLNKGLGIWANSPRLPDILEEKGMWGGGVVGLPLELIPVQLCYQLIVQPPHMPSPHHGPQFPLLPGEKGPFFR